MGIKNEISLIQETADSLKPDIPDDDDVIDFYRAKRLSAIQNRKTPKSKKEIFYRFLLKSWCIELLIFVLSFYSYILSTGILFYTEYTKSQWYYIFPSISFSIYLNIVLFLIMPVGIFFLRNILYESFSSIQKEKFKVYYVLTRSFAGIIISLLVNLIRYDYSCKVWEGNLLVVYSYFGSECNGIPDYINLFYFARFFAWYQSDLYGIFYVIYACLSHYLHSEKVGEKRVNIVKFFTTHLYLLGFFNSFRYFIEYVRDFYYIYYIKQPQIIDNKEVVSIMWKSIESEDYNKFIESTSSAGKEIDFNKEVLQSGKSMLHIASKKGLDNFVNFLIRECKMDPLSRDSKGATPMHEAARFGSIKIIDLLKNVYNIDINIEDDLGNTPLHYACKWGSYVSVKFLIQKCKVDTEKKNSKGKTPLQVAQNWRRDIICKFIENMETRTYSV